jgi:hypothetical protein
VCSAYSHNPAIFLAAIGILSALVATIPLTFAIIKRRRMSRPFEPNSLSLNGGGPGSSSNGSIRRSSSGTPTETTHLLTLKDAYASIHPQDDDKKKKLRGRSIVIKSNLEQDPFRLSGGLWDSKHLAAAAAESLAKERSQDMAAAAAAALDTDDEGDPLIRKE